MTDRISELDQEDKELYEHVRIVVDPKQKFLRVDKFLMNRIENTSRNRIQNAITAGSVRVGGKEVKASYKVKPHDEITVVLPDPPRDTEVIPEDIPLNILYEDEDLLIVNKEAGMVVHPGYNNYTGTLVNALAYHFSTLPSLPGNLGRPGLVHRIDKNTSGILAIAKSEWAMTFLAKQFYDHSIKRQYIALAWGDIEKDGTVTGYLGRSPRDRRVMNLYQEPDKGKWSVTHYQVLERLGYVTLIQCELETGRTHQIRAHMQAIGHPLFGDVEYGGNKILKGTVFNKYRQFVENSFQILPRQALHAHTLGFLHPKTKEYREFQVPLPQDFSSVLERWKAYVGTNENNIGN
ncbi:MAG TPA: RluA family pseudouridine synthase [Candidatus Sphingobacterium stercoripullorum]|uniref:Pseudouridine synthase n=1 Tax=Candidatus Sphingobacterium stercoripullorum TaxID=2838759 RepID=A0A9D1W9V7_9SPHI|nr:RluA family pseudouridine synthase [Candidatus Sphingobacterium stercoripullorum]